MPSFLTQASARSSLHISNASILSPFRFFGQTQARTATKKTGGAVDQSGTSAGKRLGLKRSPNQLVYKGEILMRQRGTHYHAGENVSPNDHVGVARDFTLYALQTGYMQIYQVPRYIKSVTASMYNTPDTPKRLLKSMVGITLKKGQTLPYNAHEEGRRRFFGKVDQAYITQQMQAKVDQASIATQKSILQKA